MHLLCALKLLTLLQSNGIAVYTSSSRRTSQVNMTIEGLRNPVKMKEIVQQLTTKIDGQKIALL